MDFLTLVDDEMRQLEESAMTLQQKEMVSDLMQAGWSIEDKAHGQVFMTRDGRHRMMVDRNGKTSVLRDDVAHDVSDLVEDLHKLGDDQLDAILS